MSQVPSRFENHEVHTLPARDHMTKVGITQHGGGGALAEVMAESAITLDRVPKHFVGICGKKLQELRKVLEAPPEVGDAFSKYSSQLFLLTEAASRALTVEDIAEELRKAMQETEA